jgi:hypothetical protein
LADPGPATALSILQITSALIELSALRGAFETKDVFGIVVGWRRRPENPFELQRGPGFESSSVET